MLGISLLLVAPMREMFDFDFDFDFDLDLDLPTALEEREDAMEFTEPERVRVDGVAARFGGHGQKSS
jgi:hypothetical protein